MSTDPRLALEALVAAFNEHLVAVQNSRGEDDPAVEAAFFSIADAFEAYEDALYASTGEVTPLEVFGDDDDDDEELDDLED
ncbi:hypothetical protein M3C74_03545 [Micrococcus lylae]|uniref:hypothetical protein n=1 Tax=Micrococcus lylae TaxID=1273 RepID=UPI0021A5B427|nr:hypothetical protein [Micrococcus lylae]MCT2007243.1 hypothetical protein [Micrococcus lylae]MCT2070915.1 hypothetical protein [Micrococcus lylae]